MPNIKFDTSVHLLDGVFRRADADADVNDTTFGDLQAYPTMGRSPLNETLRGNLKTAGAILSSSWNGGTEGAINNTSDWDQARPFAHTIGGAGGATQMGTMMSQQQRPSTSGQVDGDTQGTRNAASLLRSRVTGSQGRDHTLMANKAASKPLELKKKSLYQMIGSRDNSPAKPNIPNLLGEGEEGELSKIMVDEFNLMAHIPIEK